MKNKVLLLGIISLLLVFVGLLQGQKANAGVGLSFGGRIVTTEVPGVECASGYGIISITPAGKFQVTDYATTGFYPVVTHVGGYILGLYSPIMAPLCVDDAGTPWMAFPVTYWGSGK